MEKFIIHGAQPLRGTLTPSGNKNAVLPMMAACLLTPEPVILHNVPDILDVQTMIRLMQSLNVKIDVFNETTLKLDASDIHPADLDPALCRQIEHPFFLPVR